MSKRLRDSEDFPVGSLVEVSLGPKKIRGRVAWSVMSEVLTHKDHVVLRVNYDLGGWYIFVLSPSGKDACIDASIRVLSNIGEQLGLL